MIAYEKLKIGEKIRKIRELKGLTRDYVADKLSISPRSFADIENETVNITLKRLVEIANIFECNLEEILMFYLLILRSLILICFLIMFLLLFGGRVLV